MKNDSKIKPLTIDQLKSLFHVLELHGVANNDYRMLFITHLLFRLVRIDDILLTLRKKHFYPMRLHSETSIETFIFTEKKTNIERTIPILGKSFFHAIFYHGNSIKDKNDEDNLFYGDISKKPMSKGLIRNEYLKFINCFDIDQISPTSIRKTGALLMYRNGFKLKSISMLLSHNSVKYTAQYLGIDNPRPKHNNINSIKCYNPFSDF